MKANPAEATNVSKFGETQSHKENLLRVPGIIGIYFSMRAKVFIVDAK
jgi:hypothetical protein